jgi:hypothetical protein
MELAVRLGTVTGKGLTELVKEHYGGKVALFSVIVLTITCFGAVVSEMSCIAQAGMLWGVPPWVSALAVFVLLLAICIIGSYRQVELVGTAMGSLQLLFIPVAFYIMTQRNEWGTFGSDLGASSFSNPRYSSLLAANVGAVIMPWMVFYHQSAVSERVRKAEEEKAAQSASEPAHHCNCQPCSDGANLKLQCTEQEQELMLLNKKAEASDTKPATYDLTTALLPVSHKGNPGRMFEFDRIDQELEFERIDILVGAVVSQVR